MGSRLKFALLVSVALLALGASIVVLYGFITNDWRLTRDLLDFSIFPHKETDPDARVRSRRWELDLADSGTVIVKATGASVQVARGAVQKVVVEAWMEGDATDSTKFSVQARLENPSTLHITAQPTSHWMAATPGKVRLIVTLPGRNNLKIETLGGETMIDGITGSIVANTTGGNLAVTGVNGPIVLKSMQGDITVERSTVSGKIDVDHGQLEMSYTDGALDVSATSEITARSHVGRLIARSEKGISAELISTNVPCRLVAEHGDVKLWLLPGASATFDIRSQTGQITNYLPLDSSSVLEWSPTRLRAAMNGGGDSVVIHAGSGNVLLQEFGTRDSLRP
jgi:hypothetical protein